VLLSSETKLTNSPYKAEVKLISGQKKPKITEKDHAFKYAEMKIKIIVICMVYFGQEKTHP